MKLRELLDVPLPYTLLGSNDPEKEIDRICDDSRAASAGALFVAVEGAVSDGHDYLLSAYKLGCRAFVVEKKADVLPDDATVAVFEDSRKALALLSARILGDPAKKLTLIGITGTKGKTTTALMLKGIMCKAGINTGYIGSNGVIYGDVALEDTKNTTPGSLELNKHLANMVSAGMTHAVLEVSSQALFMNRVFGMRFDTVIFTNIGRDDHIGGAEHPTFEHYVECKRTLFFDHGARYMIANIDDEFAPFMTPPTMTPITVSLNKNADYTAKDVCSTNENGILGTTAVCTANGEEYSAFLRLPGKFNVMNAMSAVAAASCYGIAPKLSFKILRDISVSGRFESVPVANDRVFVIDYAHNGLALRSVLSSLREYEPKRLICVFGSVGGRTQSRRKPLGDAAAEFCDFAIITADNPDYEAQSNIAADILRSFENSSCKAVAIDDRETAIKFALANSRAGDIILFAGKGHEKYQLIEGRKEYFCERELIIKHKEVITAGLSAVLN